MRTTLTLDDDVAVLLARVQKERGATFREVVNTALRRGLEEMQANSKPQDPFHTQALDLGCSRLPNLDSIAEALAIAESERHH